MILRPIQEGVVCDVWRHLWLPSRVAMLWVYSKKKPGHQEYLIIFRTIPHNQTVSDWKCLEFYGCIACPCTIQVFLKLTTPYTVCRIEMPSGSVEIIERIKFYPDHTLTLEDPNFFSFQYFFFPQTFLLSSLTTQMSVSIVSCLNWSFLSTQLEMLLFSNPALAFMGTYFQYIFPKAPLAASFISSLSNAISFFFSFTFLFF